MRAHRADHPRRRRRAVHRCPSVDAAPAARRVHRRRHDRARRSLLQSLAEGFAIVGIIGVFGAFNAVVSHHELRRQSHPAAFHEAGLVVDRRALAFVPVDDRRRSHDVREADRARTGGESCAAGAWSAQVVPVLETGLERAVTPGRVDGLAGLRPRPRQAARSTARLGGGLVALLALGGAFVALVGRGSHARGGPGRRRRLGLLVAAVALASGVDAGSATDRAALRADRRRSSLGTRRSRRRPGGRRRRRGRATRLDLVRPARCVARRCASLPAAGVLALPSPPSVAHPPAPVDRDLPARVDRMSAPSSPSTGVGLRATPTGRPALRRRRPRRRRRARCCSSSARRGRARARCCAPSTAWSPTHRRALPAARSVVRSLAPRTTGPATWPTSSASSHQDPEAQFVVDQVEHDIAFVLENLGMDPAAMRRRVEEVLDALGVAHLRHRSPVHALGRRAPAGCAIAGALAAAPDVARARRADRRSSTRRAPTTCSPRVARLNDDLGTTVLLAEHRLERAAPLADRAVLRRRRPRRGPRRRPGACSPAYAGAPPVTHLGRLLGWDPPPLTVRDARAGGPRPRRCPGARRPPARPRRATPSSLAPTGLERRASAVDRCSAGVDLEVGRRRGRGAARSQRRRARPPCCGPWPGCSTPASGHASTRAAPVAYVPQDPNALLFAPTVRAEVRAHAAPARPPRPRRRRRAGSTRLGLDRPRRPPPAQPLGRPAPAGGHRRRRRRGAPTCCCSTSRPAASTPPSRAALERAVRRARRRRRCGRARHPRRRARRPLRDPGGGARRRRGRRRRDRPATVLAGSLFAPQVLRVAAPVPHRRRGGAALARR